MPAMDGARSHKFRTLSDWQRRAIEVLRQIHAEYGAAVEALERAEKLRAKLQRMEREYRKAREKAVNDES